VAIGRRSPGNFRVDAHIESGLAWTLWRNHGDRARALELMQSARDRMVAGGATGDELGSYERQLADLRQLPWASR
jgi:hypothetical protein